MGEDATSLAPRGLVGVVALMKHAQEHMWEPIPERASGMGSERIATVLNFRRKWPPVVSVAHLIALGRNATQTERELARLVTHGTLRKLTVSRGVGESAVGEGYVLIADWTRRVQIDDLDKALQEKYISLLTAATGQSVSMASLTPDEVKVLVKAGYLTYPAITAAAPASKDVSSLALGISGSLAAVGGGDPIHERGGGSSSMSERRSKSKSEDMTLTLPGMGTYFKLITDARTRLLALLKRVSPKHRECTMASLKESWDGNRDTVKAGKTKKWREFYGLEFDYVLAEAVGSGLVDLFQTPVGIGVRAR
ncbi:hypothetical protein K470DRAFT_283302 [Piedraia hortae CBS 480.64]|uniref:Serine-threonine protein kinase 19 n=1 Tax=Piedraia hortae CBS 480.64 TaxID=1314780 RepID=A0A6A7BUF3_9PEZI|nr:hypothetical protein K470DRAFT_283302 [Piedraia hortae CBS 480.64]